MKVVWTCVVISTLAVLAGACSKKKEQAQAVQPVEAPAEVPQEMPPEAPAPTPSDHRVPAVVEGDAGHAQQKLTPEELMGLVAPTETPPPVPNDHRLRLGIDGDSGYTQQELTPEELAAARAAGAAAPQPSYAPQLSAPSHAEQPSESPDEVEDEASGTVYVGGDRAPVIRHDIREEAKEGDRREPRPVTLPDEPPRSNAAPRVPRR